MDTTSKMIEVWMRRNNEDISRLYTEIENLKTFIAQTSHSWSVINKLSEQNQFQVDEIVRLRHQISTLSTLLYRKSRN